jgi:hypothetical protein
MKDKADHRTADMLGAGRIDKDAEHRLTGELAARVTRARTASATELFDERISTLATALAFTRREFDDGMLLDLYDHIYMPVARDDKRPDDQRAGVFPRPDKVKRTEDGGVDVDATAQAQTRDFLRAADLHLSMVGAHIGRIEHPRKPGAGWVHSYRSIVWSPTSARRVSPSLSLAIETLFPTT